MSENIISQIAEGIVFRSTPGHGYVDISADRLAAMPEALKTKTRSYNGGFSFEEDVEWSRVAIAFPEEFKEQQDLAHKTLKDYHPDIYEAWANVVIPIEESGVKSRRNFLARHLWDWLALTAWGSWHDDVPAGFVAVAAHLGGDQQLEERYFLVAKDDYKWSTVAPYVVDIERDKEIDPIS